MLGPVVGVGLEPDHVTPSGACRGYGVTYDGARVSMAALGRKGDDVLDLDDPPAVEIQYPQLAQPHLQDGVPKPLEGDRQGVGVDTGLLFRVSQTHVDGALERPPGAHQPVGAGRWVAVDPVDATV